jgi:hypothetical protein
MICFVDADHGGCKATGRSHSGIIIFVYRAPILWFSTQQNTVEESSTFGSEFVALRIAVEMIAGLRYKLRMMGVEIDGPCPVLCDNRAIYLNSAHPASMLKKKHAAINYHRVREAVGGRYDDEYCRLIDEVFTWACFAHLCRPRPLVMTWCLTPSPLRSAKMALPASVGGDLANCIAFCITLCGDC